MSELRPHAIAADRVFDGSVVHHDAAVVIEGARIIKLIPRATLDSSIATHALFPEAAYSEMVSAGIRSIRSTQSVAHFTNAIALDELFIDALKGELSEAPQ